VLLAYTYARPPASPPSRIVHARMGRCTYHACMQHSTCYGCMRARAPITRPQAKPVRRALGLGFGSAHLALQMASGAYPCTSALTHAATAPAQFDVGPQVWYDATWSGMLQHGVVCCNMVGLALDRLWFRLGRLRCLRFACCCGIPCRPSVFDPMQRTILRR
jgi:hypothetical protein